MLISLPVADNKKNIIITLEYSGISDYLSNILVILQHCLFFRAKDYFLPCG